MTSYEDVINMMNGSTFRDRNLSGYTIVNKLEDGARYKCWVTKESNKYLYKENKKHSNGLYTYENYSEYIAMLIGHSVDIKCVDILLCENAVLSRVMTNNELHTFTELSEEFSHSFHLSNLTTYNISTLLDRKYNTFYKDVIEMLMFDALIGNSDRHPGNFMYSSEGFYPLFDNGSSLCAYIEDSSIDAILRDNMRFESINTTKSKPVVRDSSKITHKELLSILKFNFPKEYANVANKIVTLDVDSILNKVNMPILRHELLGKFLKYRLEWFKE